MIKLGDKIRLGIMFGFLALVAYVWIEAIVLIQWLIANKMKTIVIIIGSCRKDPG